MENLELPAGQATEHSIASRPAASLLPADAQALAKHLNAVQTLSDHIGSVITQLSAAQTAQAEAQALHEKYLHRVIVAADQFANALTDGDLDETISARAGRAALQGKQWGIDLCKLLDKFQANHDPQAQAGDVARAEKVIALERGSGGITMGALDEPEAAHSPESAALPQGLSIADVSHDTALDLLKAKSAEEEAHPGTFPNYDSSNAVTVICGHTETQRGAPTGRVCQAPAGHDAHIDHDYK